MIIQRKKSYGIFTIISACVIFLLPPVCFANTITIKKNYLIDKPTKYNNVTLDLSQGNFTVDHEGSLDIEDSVINVTISPQQPFFVNLVNGSLILKRNIISVTINNIPPDPDNPSLFYLIQITQGLVDIEDNSFYVDQSYTLGLFVTNLKLTSGFHLSDNKIKHFHGGFYLLNSSNVEISNNRFLSVSSGNVVLIQTTDSKVIGNIFNFAGTGVPGNSIDIFNSNRILVQDNFITSDNCYGMQVLGSKNVLIDNNVITNGITYAIKLATYTTALKDQDKWLVKLIRKYASQQILANENITITNNYISQNRYGLMADSVNDLTVQNNIFIQRFTDDPSRKFWTNNILLLTNISNLIWQNNSYKEAYSQEVPGDNSQSFTIVNFPEMGGVVLP